VADHLIIAISQPIRAETPGRGKTWVARAGPSIIMRLPTAEISCEVVRGHDLAGPV
jgi:hypothetical protein